jgi:hypothetical protein
LKTRDFAEGGYRYIEGVFQYSAGVQALKGHEIVRLRFREPPRLAEGFRRIERHLGDIGRPLAALCACELRSPAPFSEAGFRSFNESYVSALDRWGIVQAGKSPLARSNVCPEISPPAEPGFHAFCFTRPAAEATAPSFVISGSGETIEGSATYLERVVAFGDTSPQGMRKKARHVLGEMERRLEGLGLSWADTTDSQVYTVYDIHSFLADELVGRGAAARGFTWHFARPPVEGLDFEVDCRGIATEVVA